MKNLNISLDHQILDGELQTEFVNLDLDKIEFVTIESVHTTKLNTEVYDLEIDQVPNYTTNIGVVHNGGGRRKGSIAVYLEPWHADVFDFLDLRKNHGKEELRARDLFLAMWIPNLFMERVESDGLWSLFSPDEVLGLIDAYDSPEDKKFTELYTKYERDGKATKTIKARELWEKILDSQIETGTPYMLYKDAVNYKSNQKNLGTIKSSNLCITGDQRVVTTKGYLTAKELCEMDVELELFNGSEIVKSSKMIKRGENEDVYKITLENGMEHKVTPYHGIPVIDSRNNITRIECKDLKIGDKIPVQTNKGLFGSKEMVDEAFLLGLYQSDGTQNKSSIFFDLWENDFDLVEEIENKIQKLYSKHEYKPRYSTKGGKFIDCAVSFSKIKKKRLSSEFFKKELLFEKGYVPEWIWSSNEETQWSYLRGLLFADGTANKNKSKGEPIQISYVDINIDFLKELQLIFQNLGLQTSIRLLRNGGQRSLPNGKGGYSLYKTKDCYRLIVGNKNDSQKINEKIGFLDRKNIIIDNREFRDNTKKGYKVKSIEYVGKEDVYCPTIYNDEHIFISQGLKTFNCTEILEFTSKDEIAVCNLASVALPKFIDIPSGKVREKNKKLRTYNFKKLYEVVYQMTNNLNRVIDVNYYPTPETKNSNLRHRPIGLGVQGLADTFAMLSIPFESPEAQKLNKEIFETIYFAALTASNDLAKRDGTYASYHGSPASQGKLQFEFWGVDVDQLSGLWDWYGLKESIKEHGLRNSLLVAPMPTASTAQILGNNECFEPFTTNLYKRNVLSGEFVIINKHLVDDLVNLGMWNDRIRLKLFDGNGSVQKIEEIPADIREVYKTVWEMKGKTILDMARDRAVFIDQSQSLNLFMQDVTPSKLSSAHMYGWKLGLKTGMYYLRTKAKAAAIKGLGVDMSQLNSLETEEKTTPKIKIENNNLNISEEMLNKVCSLDDPDCLTCSS